MALNNCLPSSSPLVTVKDIEFFHGRRRILSDVTLSFRAGRHYVIAGPNGAGKSTFLDLIAQLKKPAAGVMEIMGKNANAHDIDELSRLVSLAPQDAGVNFPFTIRETVAMGRRPYIGRWGILNAEDWRIVDDAISKVHLTGLAGQAVTTLSGGERRRTIVARTLAQKTPILLLDEPTAGLDVNQALTIMTLAKTLAGDGALVITVTHDLNLAGTFADECVFLKDGKVAAVGATPEVFTPAILSGIYDTEAFVSRDEFTGGLAASFRLR